MRETRYIQISRTTINIINIITIIINIINLQLVLTHTTSAISTNKHRQYETNYTQQNLLSVLSATTTEAGEDISVIPHMLINPPSRSHALRGQTFVLSCQAVGHPTPRITWYKDSSPVIGQRGRVSAFQSGYLIISDTHLSDEGQYTCEAHNGVGNVSRTTTLIVTKHESGCRDGVTDGLHEYEHIHACAGSWDGHVKKAGRDLCSTGWQVCSPRHTAYLKMMTWADVISSLDGCFAYNAANSLNLCTPCVSGEMAGVGSGCSRHVSAERSCLAEGRVDVYNNAIARKRKKNGKKSMNRQKKKEVAQQQGCHYSEGLTTGVLCCKKPEKWQIGFRWKAPKCRPRCMNGGVCISSNVCRCPYGYKGTVCQNPVCEGGCIPNSVCVRPGMCRCLAGYSGPKCRKKDRNSTEGGPSCSRSCLFGGKCKNGLCKCPPTRRGKYCQNGMQDRRPIVNSVTSSPNNRRDRKEPENTKLSSYSTS